jgi:hypothetical protein
LFLAKEALDKIINAIIMDGTKLYFFAAGAFKTLHNQEMTIQKWNERAENARQF